MVVGPQICLQNTDVLVQRHGVKPAQVVGVRVCAEHKIQRHAPVRTAAVTKQKVHDCIFIALVFQVRLVFRILRILRRIDKGVVPLAFEQDAVGHACVQKIDLAKRRCFGHVVPSVFRSVRFCGL